MGTTAQPRRHGWIDRILVYPGMEQDGLLQKASVLTVQCYVLVMTAVAIFVKVPALISYGISLLVIGTAAILVYTFVRKKHLEWVIYVGMVLSVLVSFYFIVSLGGIASSGGLIMAGPALIILSLVFRNKSWTLMLAIIYVVTILASILLQPIIGNEAGLTASQNLLFFTCNTLLLTGITVSVILSLFSYNARANRAQKAEERMHREKAITKTRLYEELENTLSDKIQKNIELANRALSEDGQQVSGYLKSIRQRERHMLQLLRQVHELARVEAGLMQINKIQSDFIRYTRHLSGQYQSFASGKDITIKFISNVEQFNFDFDPHKVADLFSLLLSDAIVRSNRKGEITVAVNREQENSFKDLVEIVVSDSGKSIEENDLKCYFKNGQQDLFSGNGEHYARLAYSLSGSLVRLMGGKLFARSKSERGTRIRIHLPVQNALPFTGHHELIQQQTIEPFFMLSKEDEGRKAAAVKPENQISKSAPVETSRNIKQETAN